MPTVEIFGRSYNITGTPSTGTIRALARYVDATMRQVSERVGRGDAVRVAVLAALNIADDYIQTREALERREGEIAAQARELVAVLEEAMGAGSEAGRDEA